MVAERARVMEADLGEASGEGLEPKVFVLRLGAGVEAGIAINSSREDKDRLGYLAYVAEGLRQAVSLEPAEWTITAGETQEHAVGVSAAIANAGHMGFAQLQFDDEIVTDDGVLDAVVIPGSNLGEAAVAATSLLGADSGRLLHLPGTQFRLDADPPQPVVLDGEEYGMTPVSARVLPHALKVIVPAS